MSGYVTAVLVRDSDCREVAWEIHSGGSGTAQTGFRVWSQRWTDLGFDPTADAENLTLSRRWDAHHTAVVRWHEVPR